jgi:hypothetical protein
MSRDHFWIAILGVAIVNGIFSPYLVPVWAMRGLWYPFFLPASPAIALFISSLVVSTLTLMIAGVPAGLYERMTGARESGPASMWIWLAGSLFLALPALQNALSILRA